LGNHVDVLARALTAHHLLEIAIKLHLAVPLPGFPLLLHASEWALGHGHHTGNRRIDRGDMSEKHALRYP